MVTACDKTIMIFIYTVHAHVYDLPGGRASDRGRRHVTYAYICTYTLVVEGGVSSVQVEGEVDSNS